MIPDILPVCLIKFDIVCNVSIYWYPLTELVSKQFLIHKVLSAVLIPAVKLSHHVDMVSIYFNHFSYGDM